MLDLWWVEREKRLRSALAKTLRLRAEVLLQRREWDEDKHPRVPAGGPDGGQFGAGGGDGIQTTPETPGSGMDHAAIQSAIDKVAKDAKFDKSRIDISDETRTFVLNGKTYIYAGAADISPPAKNDRGEVIGHSDGRITIYSKHVSPSFVHGAVRHEIEHIKYQTAFDRYQAEITKVSNDPGPPPDPNGEYYWQKNGGKDAVMKPDGGLREPYDKKYPIYTAWHEASNKYSTEFADADGVSDYSFEYWKAWKAGTVGTHIAMHETLAEMARIKYETGKFPDHLGERILSYRGEDKPKPSEAVMANNAKIWRELYRTVEKIYAEA